MELVRTLACGHLTVKLLKSRMSRGITSCAGITTARLGIKAGAHLNTTLTVMHNRWRKLAESYRGETERGTCWISRTGDEIVTMLSKIDKIVPDKGQTKFQR